MVASSGLIHSSFLSLFCCTKTYLEASGPQYWYIVNRGEPLNKGCLYISGGPDKSKHYMDGPLISMEIM